MKMSVTPSGAEGLALYSLECQFETVKKYQTVHEIIP